MCSLAQRGSQNTNTFAYKCQTTPSLSQIYRLTIWSTIWESNLLTGGWIERRTQDISNPLDRFLSLTNTHSSFLVLWVTASHCTASTHHLKLLCPFLFWTFCCHLPSWSACYSCNMIKYIIYTNSDVNSTFYSQSELITPSWRDNFV